MPVRIFFDPLHVNSRENKRGISMVNVPVPSTALASFAIDPGDVSPEQEASQMDSAIEGIAKCLASGAVFYVQIIDRELIKNFEDALLVLSGAVVSSFDVLGSCPSQRF
jgi:hypothetical protein